MDAETCHNDSSYTGAFKCSVCGARIPILLWEDKAMRAVMDKDGNSREVSFCPLCGRKVEH